MRRKPKRRFTEFRPEPLDGRLLLSTLIAEIDTGVDLKSLADLPYYDLADGYNAYTGQPATPSGSNVADNSLGGGHGHGSTTADSIVSGILAANSQPGASPADVKIMPIRVTSNSGAEDGGTFNAVIKGIFYAAYHHAAVINLSIAFLETVDSPAFVPTNPDPSYTNPFPNFGDAIAYARSKGAVVVTAAGNDHYNIDSTNSSLNGYLPNHLFPTSDLAPNLIVAASTDPSGNLTAVSNFGATHVNIGAPAIQNATSYAAGYISGVAGVLAALSPGLSADQLVGVIELSAQASPHLAGLISTGAVISPANAVDAVFTPTVVTPATATPGEVTGTTVALTTLGQDVLDESKLTYTWTVLNGTGVTFGPDGINGTNAAKSLTATFSHPGTYRLEVLISAGPRRNVTSDMTVTVSATPTRLVIAPLVAIVTPGGTLPYSATIYDQFGAPISPPPPVTWSVDAGGVGGRIDSSGAYQAPATGVGTDTVRVQIGTLSQSSLVNVISPSPPIVPGTIAIASGPGGGAGIYAGDVDANGGNLFQTTAGVDISGVADPAPATVYQSERWSSTGFSYAIPGLVPGGTYTVRLHFAEIYFTSVGQRLFNVAINGSAALTNFDIVAAAGGPRKAVIESFVVTADANGRITIAYTNVRGGAKSSAIEVIPFLAALS